MPNHNYLLFYSQHT